MHHIDFIAWMILFPMSTAFTDCIRAKYLGREKYSEETKAMASLILIIIWITVGILLY